ncbi:MAG: ABC transporter substrate-binding protein [Desulfovibrionaceae bacterium]|nr:ABC transporter substrate-binding protein [Desulfovibrionaceae bacterium]
MLDILRKSLGGLALGVVMVVVLMTGAAKAAVTIQVTYAYAVNYKTVTEEIAAKFMAQHPRIKVEIRTPAVSYEKLAQDLLRDKITNTIPDVAFNGINQLGLFAQQKLAVALDDYVKADGGAEKLGYSPALAALGRHDGKQYGIPFAISTPVVYVNLDLLSQAGVDVNSLTSWPAILAAGQAIDSKIGTPTSGFYFEWDQTGNWLFQALITANGGKVLTDDESDIAFDSPAGMAALKIFESFPKAGMKNLGQTPARQAFVAGNIGILASSSSQGANMERMVGDKFKMKTLVFPVGAHNPRLPSGGAMAMVLSTDKERQKAAWEFVKFATGAEGQTIMGKGTGYTPVNQVAINTPELLGDFYKQFPNRATPLEQLPILTQWVSYPGDNSLKLIEVIKGHTESLITGAKTAEQTMPVLVRDVRALLPNAAK